jgi:hypothetical protein
MKKKYLFTLSVLCLFIFTYCSTEKEYLTDKPNNGLTDKPDNCLETDFTLLPKNHVPDSDLYVEGEILQNQSSNPKFMLSTRKFQGVPSIGKDRSGNLYVGWIAAQNCVGECNENYLTVSLSKDKGRSWSHNKLILDVNPQDSTRMKDLNFFNDKFGNLYMYWGKHVQKKSVVAKEWAISWYSKLSLSNDGNTICYSPPRRIAEGIMLNKLFYSSISNEVVFPIAYWHVGVGDPELHQPFIYKANYGVNNLTNFRKVGFIPLDGSAKFIYEHMIVQLKDSTYYGMVRTPKGIYYSKSKDGNTWDKGRKFTDLGATADSRFYLGKLSSGRLILIFNNAITRTNMTICLSDDDGITWGYKMLIDNTADGFFGVSYPDMIETDPGILNIVYDYLRAPAGTINFVEIKEEDIVNNNQPKFFKTKISSIK